MATPAPAASLPELLRLRDFRRLLGARLVSQLADGTFQVALASLFFFSPQRQTTSGRVAVAFAVLLLPYSLVGPFAGVFLDRWRRRTVLVRANLVRPLVMAAAAVLVARGVVGPVLYVLVLVVIGVNRFLLAALSAALPHVVPASSLVTANALATTAGTVTAVVGAGVGFVLRLSLGSGDGTDALLVLVAAVLCLVAARVAATMAKDLLGPDAGPDRAWEGSATLAAGVLRGLGQGAARAAAARPVAVSLATIGAHRFAYGVSTISTILLCRNHFATAGSVDSGVALLGATVAAAGAGYVVAAVVTPSAVARLGRVAWVVTSLWGAGLTYLVVLVSLRRTTLLVAAFLLGVAAQAVKIVVDTTVQNGVDDDVRGRVFSLYDVLFNVAFVAAAMLAVLVVPPEGWSAPLFTALVVGYGGLGAAFAVASRRGDEPVVATGGRPAAPPGGPGR